MENKSGVSDFQQLQERWSTQIQRLYVDSQPLISQAMNSRCGQYLSSHPFLALAVMLFSAMAALPVGLFLIFALVTVITSTVGFVFFEVFVLFAGMLTLLCVLSGLAIVSVIVSFILMAFYTTISNILMYYSELAKQVQDQEKDQDQKKEKDQEKDK
uniref:lipid droplet assembly factor 1-like isoform X2 n=1 Tax=Solea senegalensis TaxID=28829 RepID=UPI001CD875F7|nr:lipid droplet assembly factor 1-like isoform X2 [Solea senegalensis]